MFVVGVPPGWWFVCMPGSPVKVRPGVSDWGRNIHHCALRRCVWLVVLKMIWAGAMFVARTLPRPPGPTPIRMIG